MSEPCVCTHGPHAHDREDGDCTVRGCWCVSYQPESSVYGAGRDGTS